MTDLERRLKKALEDLMEAVGDMPADPRECWPEEFAAADSVLDAYDTIEERTK